jgi:hypothetical protein
VFSNPKWQRFALILNLAETAILFYSFQATSSDFRLVTTKIDSVMNVGGEFKQYALCVNNFTLIHTDSRHGMEIGIKGCPDWENSRPAAVVNVEHPIFVGIGFVTLLAGFFIQYLSVPQPKTISEIRNELKDAKKRRK